MRGNLTELPVLLCCLWCGFALGIFYDLLRPVRCLSAVTAALSDLLFGAVFFALTAAALLYADNGTLRGFALPAIALSFALWQRLPGRLIRGVLRLRKTAGKNRNNEKL